MAFDVAVGFIGGFLSLLLNYSLKKLLLRIMDRLQRIFEVAAELKVTSRSILDYLSQLKFDVRRNQMQPVTEEMFFALLYKFDNSRFNKFAEDLPVVKVVTDKVIERISKYGKDISDLKFKPATEIEKKLVPDDMPEPKIITVAKTKEPVPVEKVKLEKTVKQSTVKKPIEKVNNQLVKKPQVEEIKMGESSENEVNSAFNNLLGVLQFELKNITKLSMAAIEKGNFEAARMPLERAAHLSKLLEKLFAVKSGWEQLFQNEHAKVEVTMEAQEEVQEQVVKEVPIIVKKSSPVITSTGHIALKRGSLTSSKLFYKPILSTLVELGGSAPKLDVVEKVKSKMKNVFNQHDLEPPPSHPTIPRWLITMDKVRSSLIKKKLMSKNVEPGLWEISTFGRKELKKMK